MMRANESTFSGTVKLDDLIWTLLGSYGVTARRLSNNNVYTFRLTDKNICRLDCHQSIHYLGSFDKTTMKLDIKDPVRYLVPHIPVISIPAKSLKSYKDVYEVVGRILAGLVKQCSLASPIQFVCVKSTNRVYCITTPTGQFANKA